MTSSHRDREVRVRFAPSPTGHLHIGGLRTSIFNWLFARHNNGKFLLRIEDTDIERSKQEYTDSILETFNWMSMGPDEPIVIQSKRLSEHTKLINRLIKEGKAYRCFCSEKNEDNDNVVGSKYDRTCRDKKASDEDLENKKFAVRFKIPRGTTSAFDDLYKTDQIHVPNLLEGFIEFHDKIYGTITFPLDQFDDFIIARSDGTPTYNFVVVVDDIYMRISHVIRGEDHINNTPKQILLYNALDAKIPEFAHLPSILNASGQKLSKRDGAVSVLEYKRNGFLADAIFNYLVRLGWSHGDQEIFTREELVQYFTFNEIGKKGAIFDLSKLEWVNSVYIRKTSENNILDLIERDVDPLFLSKISFLSKDQVLALINLYKERVKNLEEIENEIILIDKEPKTYDKNGLEEFVKPESIEYLEILIHRLNKIDHWTEEEISTNIKQLCKELKIKLPDIAQLIRLAITGTINSPSIFSLLAIMAKEETLRRLNIFLNYLRRERSIK